MRLCSHCSAPKTYLEKVLFRPSGLANKILKREIKRVIHNDSKLRIVELRNDVPADLASIRDFREGIYARENPALLKEILSKKATEDALDERSYHFAALNGDEIVGTLRVTSFPFEMETVTQSFQTLTKNLRKFLEFNRFVVAPRCRNMGIGKKLTYFVYLKFHDTAYLGIAAICRRERAPTFERMGMEKINLLPIRVPERGDAEYFVLASCWHHLVRDMVAYYGGRVVKRWFTGKDTYQTNKENSHAPQ